MFSLRFVVPLLALFMLPGLAGAAPYSSLYVFGDSLSDRGNLAGTGVLQTLAGQPVANFPDPPSNSNSFTNGPVAISLLASRLGLAANPSLWPTGFQDVNGLFGPGFVPGTNYAVAGATAQAQAVGGPPTINLPQQLAAYLFASGGVADPTALYTVFVGGNDVRNAALQGTGAAAVGAGVQTELAALSTLIGAGARNLLVINVPDIGIIPEFAQDNSGLAATARAETQLYNSGLAAGLATLPLPAGTALFEFDLFSFNAEILANAAALGFTNTTDRCYVATPLSAATTPACGPAAANIEQLVYWDSIHPTGRIHALWAEGAAQVLAGVEDPSPVPEPMTLAIMSAGLLGLLMHRRHQA